jgi:hypothetical protein
MLPFFFFLNTVFFPESQYSFHFFSKSNTNVLGYNVRILPMRIQNQMFHLSKNTFVFFDKWDIKCKNPMRNTWALFIRFLITKNISSIEFYKLFHMKHIESFVMKQLYHVWGWIRLPRYVSCGWVSRKYPQ